MGGISRTVNYKGNRIDIGGHRFFSKSDRVMKWWLNLLPLEKLRQPRRKSPISGSSVPSSVPATAPDPGRRPTRDAGAEPLSRIYFLRRFLSTIPSP